MLVVHISSRITTLLVQTRSFITRAVIIVMHGCKVYEKFASITIDDRKLRPQDYNRYWKYKFSLSVISCRPFSP